MHYTLGQNLKMKNIVILTGAGISAESGIKTFRDQNGLWENHRLEDVATPEAFTRDPKLVQHFYNLRRRQLLSDEVKPNSAHLALTELAKHHNVTLITQNVDNLHEQAGSPHVHHMHGELLKSRCIHTHQVYAQHEDLHHDNHCQCCNKKGALRPHIVWFGEIPIGMDYIYEQLEQCELFISIGTSGHVYPAAGFVEVANSSGAQSIEINLEPSQQASAFHKTIHEKASVAVPSFIKQLIER